MSNNNGTSNGLGSQIFILVLGAFIGGLVSNHFNEKSAKLQLKLDEKEIVTSSLSEYLDCYSKWYEITYYYLHSDYVEGDSIPERILEKQRQFESSFNAAYGRIYLQHGGELSLQTMVTSTFLVESMEDAAYHFISNDSFQSPDSLHQAWNNIFFSTWLNCAKRTLNNYYDGNIDRTSLKDWRFFVEDPSIPIIHQEVYNEIERAYKTHLEECKNPDSTKRCQDFIYFTKYYLNSKST